MGVGKRYRAPWFLRNPHVHTLYGALVRPAPRVAVRHERFDTPDQDFLDVVRTTADASAPRVIILHGLEGSYRSTYARSLLAAASRAGLGADLLVFRSCGREPNRARRFYHSGEISDFDFLLRRIKAENPARPLAAVGVSLGANVLLKWLATHREETLLSAAATISAPYDLARCATRLEHGFARFYQWVFLRTLRRKTLKKLAVYPDLVERTRLLTADTLRAFDDAVTAPVHGFRDAAHYYEEASALFTLHKIRVPTLLVSAADDPFVDPSVLPEVRTVAQQNPALTCAFFDQGGHVGFVPAGRPLASISYAEERAIHFLHERLAGRLSSR